MRGRSASARSAIAVVVLASAIGAAAAFGGAPDPEISGTEREGETLTATVGDPQPDNWQWERCSEGEDVCTGNLRGGLEWLEIPGADEDSYTLTSADVGEFVRVVAHDDCQFRGDTKYCNPRFSDAEGPIAPALAGPPPPPPPKPLPPPIAHQTANLIPVSGTILVKLPGSDVFIPITEATQIPLGSVIDATNGHVLVSTAKNEAGDVQTAEWWAGVFELTQTEGTPLITNFELVGPGEPAGRAAQRGRRGRRLWGRGKCRCRTRGRHSAATVRGTWWFTAETKKGTLTRVKRGRVRVKDFERRKKILVKAGEQYLAKPGSN